MIFEGIKAMSRIKKNAVLFTALVFIAIFYIVSLESPVEYLQQHDGTIAQTRINELLAQVKSDDKYLLFYLNENNNVCCAVMKKTVFSYRLLRISGELSPAKVDDNFLFSSYKEGEKYEWIDWGILQNKNDITVLSNYCTMNAIDDLPYGYTIYWILGEGEESIPPTHKY